MVRLLALAVVMAGGVAALGYREVIAQQSVTVPMTITENRVQGVGGQMTLTPMPNNMLRVQIRLTGLRPNAEHAAHIHGPGVCDVNAPITHPLNNVRADASGVGTSDTTVSIGANNPLRQPSYVNAHMGANPPGVGVICGNIPSNFGQAPRALPATGDGSFEEEDVEAVPEEAVIPEEETVVPEDQEESAEE